MHPLWNAMHISYNLEFLGNSVVSERLVYHLIVKISVSKSWSILFCSWPIERRGDWTAQHTRPQKDWESAQVGAHPCPSSDTKGAPRRLHHPAMVIGGALATHNTHPYEEDNQDLHNYHSLPFLSSLFLIQRHETPIPPHQSKVNQIVPTRFLPKRTLLHYLVSYKGRHWKSQFLTNCK